MWTFLYATVIFYLVLSSFPKSSCENTTLSGRFGKKKSKRVKFREFLMEKKTCWTNFYRHNCTYLCLLLYCSHFDRTGANAITYRTLWQCTTDTPPEIRFCWGFAAPARLYPSPRRADRNCWFSSPRRPTAHWCTLSVLCTGFSFKSK